MTQPAEPTPGAPAAEPTAQAPGAPTPLNMPQTQPKPGATGPDPNEPVDVATLPANVQHLIANLRADAAKTRTDPKVAADQARQEIAQQVAKALGIQTGDEPPDPAELTAQIEQAQAEAWRSTVELQVYRHAPQHADALLDSLKFIDSLDELVEMDPRSPDFATALEAKVQEAVASKANGQAPAATAPRPDPSQGARGAPAHGRPTSLGEAIGAHYRPA